MRALLCAAAGAALALLAAPARADTCASLGDDAQRALCRAAQLVEGQRPADAKVRPSYQQAAELLIDAWRELGSSACQSGAASCSGYGAVLLSAASSFERAGLIAKAIAVRRILIDPRYGLEQSPEAATALFELGRAYERLAIFDLAAGWYERFGTAHPGDARAARALGQALSLRLSLQQHSQALQLSQIIEQRYGQSDPASVLAAAYLIAAADLREQRFQGVIDGLSPAIMAAAGQAEVGLAIRTKELVAQAQAALGRTADSAQLDGEVLALWRKLGPAERRAQERSTVDAVAQSLLRQAGRQASTPGGAPPPALTGQPSAGPSAASLRSQPVRDWLAAEDQRRQAVAVSYAEIGALDPKPHPRWQVAAAAAVADLWHQASTQLYTLAGGSPSAPASPTAPSAPLAAALKDLAAPFAAKARAAYRQCSAVSVQLGYFDAESRRCEQWLARHYPAEHQLLDALWRRPDAAAPSRLIPPTILSDAGEPVRR